VSLGEPADPVEVGVRTKFQTGGEFAKLSKIAQNGQVCLKGKTQSLKDKPPRRRRAVLREQLAFLRYSSSFKT